MTRPRIFIRCAEAFDGRPGQNETLELLRAMIDRMDEANVSTSVEAWEDGPPRGWNRPWTAGADPGCDCPAKPGEDCPLSTVECLQRFRARVQTPQEPASGLGEVEADRSPKLVTRIAIPQSNYNPQSNYDQTSNLDPAGCDHLWAGPVGEMVCVACGTPRPVETLARGLGEVESMETPGSGPRRCIGPGGALAGIGTSDRWCSTEDRDGG